MHDEQSKAAVLMEERQTYVQVDLDAIGNNTRYFKDRIAFDKRCKLMAVVKANAYGHGAVPVARRALAHGADWLGVALPQEAMELAEAGIEAPVLVMGYTEPTAYKSMLEIGARLTIFTLEQGEALAAVAKEMGVQAKVHIKIETGMGRIGFWPDDEAMEDICTLASMKSLKLEGIFTHFARADEKDDAHWQEQMELFEDCLETLLEEGLIFSVVHCANTAAAMRDSESRMDMIRVGIGLYGLYPSAVAKDWSAVDLEPALQWKSVLSHVKTVPKGYGVSYGHDWFAFRETRVGTVPLGYADGYSRVLENKAAVLIGGIKVPVIGRICMDQMMVDLSEVPEAMPGDEVVLIGKQGKEEMSADELAGRMGTSCYETVNMISGRVPRLYLG